MKTNPLKLLFIASFIVLFTSCEFAPSEIPLTEVQKPSDTPPMIFIELKPGMDTLKLCNDATVTYTVDPGGAALYNIKFLLDGVELGNLGYYSSNSVYTNIPAYAMTDGLHELKIVTLTSTNSGSIADRVGAESYTYEVKWPVVVNKEARNNFGFYPIKQLPNGLQIRWTKYDYADFTNYKLTRYSSIARNAVDLLTTENPDLNSFVDNAYIEGDYFSYGLYSEFVGYASQTYSEEIKKPKVTLNKDLTFNVSWDQTKHLQNLKSTFLKTSIPNYGYPEEHEITDPNITNNLFTEKVGFGGNYGIQLRYIPKGYEGYNTFDVNGGYSTFALGDSIPAFERGFLIEGTNSMLIYNNGNFIRYNYSTGESSTPFAITPIESVDQRFIVSSASGELFGYFDNKQFVLRKSSDWSLVGEMDIEAYNGFNSVLGMISISNNGLVATIDIYDVLRIFNVPEGTKILEKESESPQIIQRTVLSPDGKNVGLSYSNNIENKNLLTSNTFSGGKLIEHGRYEQIGFDYESSITYSPVSGKIIHLNYLGMYNYKINILNPETLVVENSVKIPEWFIPISYDYTNDQVIAQYQFFPIKRFSYLMGVKTGLQNKIVQFTGRGPFLFSDGKVFSGNGRSIKIDDYITE